MLEQLIDHARAHKLVAALLAALLLLLALVLGLLRYLAPDHPGTRLGVAEVLSLAKQGRITDATLLDEDSMLVGRAEPAKTGAFAQGGHFSASLPSDGSLTVSLTAALSATGARVQVDDQDGKERARLLLSAFLPALVLADLIGLGLLLARAQDRSVSEPIRAATSARARDMDARGRQRTALHEAAHAVVAASLSGPERVQRVSLLESDRAAVPPLDVTGPVTAGELRNRLAALLSGVAAERVLLGEVTTRGEGDLEEATALARDMVARWGMSDVLGPMRLLEADGRGRPAIADLSPATREALDAEVRRLLLDAQTTAESVVVQHRDVVERLGDRLIRGETVEGQELRDLVGSVVHPLHAAAPPPPRVGAGRRSS